jgi:flagellar basal body P-ring protein FlgI
MEGYNVEIIIDGKHEMQTRNSAALFLSALLQHLLDKGQTIDKNFSITLNMIKDELGKLD